MFLAGSASIVGSRARSSRARTQSVEVICFASKSRIFTCLPEAAASRAIRWHSVDFPTPPFCDTTPTICRLAVDFAISANFAGNRGQCKAGRGTTRDCAAPLAMTNKVGDQQASRVLEAFMEFGFNLPNSGALATPEIMSRIAREGEA